MIRVGFIGSVSESWMGGLNYFKNLLYALSVNDNANIQPVVFVGTKQSQEIKHMFNKYAIVIEHRIFDRKSLQWLTWKVGQKFFKKNLILEGLLAKHNIQIISHSNITGFKNCKTINWIPDFQHIHLPYMFTLKEIKKRNKEFCSIIKNSDLVVVSSEDALKDFSDFSGKYIQKARILRFVSQPDEKYWSITKKAEKNIKNKYNLPDVYFYLPNQFWRHKNHLVVFEAIRLLKERGIEATVVCTGYMSDYRNKNHINELVQFIFENNLNDNIKLLGLVSYSDVYALIKCSSAVINPSLFEGWSSTVEECKSIGKQMILSDIQVHREQYNTAHFFQKSNAQSLVELMLSYINNEVEIKEVPNDLKARTLSFSKTYISIVKELG